MNAAAGKTIESAAKRFAKDRRTLGELAARGDVEAGRELIRINRIGMLEPYWETGRDRPTREDVKSMVGRRKKVEKGNLTGVSSSKRPPERTDAEMAAARRDLEERGLLGGLVIEIDLSSPGSVALRAA